jgi:heme exporter protein C
VRSLSSHIKLPAVTVVALAAAYSMVFFYAPIEVDQGFVQKIFYLHVPLAIVTLCGLIAGGASAGMFLRTGRREWDARSYVAVHISLILGVGALITGSIWAKASWGHWWVWQEPTLVSFLIVLLLFCCYMPLRFAIEDPERQARFAAVFALMGAVFIPVNFIVVRMASAFTHPRVFQVTGAQLPLSMGLTFLAALTALALLFITLCRFELRAKALRARIRVLERAELDLAEEPEQPLPIRSTPRCPPSRLEKPASTSPLPTSSF